MSGGLSDILQLASAIEKIADNVNTFEKLKGTLGISGSNEPKRMLREINDFVLPNVEEKDQQLVLFLKLFSNLSMERVVNPSAAANVP